MGRIESRLSELGLTLPSPPAPVASYVPFVALNGLVHVSGQVSMAADGGVKGRVGAGLTLEQGQQAARLCGLNLIAQVKAATAGRLLLGYLVVRQATSALGLTSLGGHPQMVRPLVAPMAEGAAEVQAGGDLPDRIRFRIRGMSAATDNIGLFFGEDIFIAIGSILLMVGFLATAGITVDPIHLSVWAIPTAIVAFLLHGGRLILFDRKLRRRAEA